MVGGVSVHGWDMARWSCLGMEVLRVLPGPYKYGIIGTQQLLWYRVKAIFLSCSQDGLGCAPNKVTDQLITGLLLRLASMFSLVHCRKSPHTFISSHTWADVKLAP